MGLSAVVFLCLIWEINGDTKTIRVLGLLRSWRLVRLVSTVLRAKDRELEAVGEAWAADQQLLEESKLEVARLEDSIERELDSKKRVETLLKSYKDEVPILFSSSLFSI